MDNGQTVGAQLPIPHSRSLLPGIYNFDYIRT